MLLQTKLFTPTLRPNFVSRQRLVQRIDLGQRQRCKLILLSAPAGFGKTTLLSEWVHGSEQAVTWLSLEEGDNDPARFWNYFIAALQVIQVGSGEAALAALESPDRPEMEAVLTGLLNEITAVIAHPS